MRTLTDEEVDMLRAELDAEPEAPDDDDTEEWPTAGEADAAWWDGYYQARDGKQVKPPTHQTLVDLYLDGFQLGLKEQERLTRQAEVLALVVPRPEAWEPEPGASFLTLRQWEMLDWLRGEWPTARLNDGQVWIPATPLAFWHAAIDRPEVPVSVCLFETVMEPGCWIDLNHSELGA